MILGRILDDVSVLGDHGIDEKKFIVIMVTKPKAGEPSASGPADPTAQPTPQAAATPAAAPAVAPTPAPAVAPVPVASSVPQQEAPISTGYVPVCEKL